MSANPLDEVPWTPGPWRVYTSDDGIHSIGIGTAATGEGVLDGGFGVWRDGPEAMANARLAAESPTMAALLEAAACPNSCTGGAFADHQGEPVQCQFCFEREALFSRLGRGK